MTYTAAEEASLLVRHQHAQTSARTKTQMTGRAGHQRVCMGFLECLAQARRAVGLLPREAAVFIGGAAEMAVRCGAPIDRPIELERAADVVPRRAEHLSQYLF